MLTIVPVILAGGAGTRLWPLSRRLLPKQFLPLAGSRTMIQETVARLEGLPDCSAPVVVANHEHRFLAAEQLAAIGVRPHALVIEPAARNTAPAIAAAALLVSRESPEALLLVLPSDHLADKAAFQADVGIARRAAADGYLLTFGIRPSAPATGYGYIEAGEPLPGEAAVHRIRRFVEKPDFETAKRFLASGAFLWNSGMFLFRARRFLDELRAHRPDILAAVERAVEGAAADLDFVRLAEAPFSACPAQSVDYAVMEKTAAGAVVKSAMRWSDVGSWSELWEVSEKDASGNAVQGDAELHDARGCYVRADSRHVSVLGVENLVVVETDDAVLVAARSRAQEVKEVVARLDRANRSEPVSHSRVYRPWGYYETVDAGAGYQVKRIMVKPGAALSLQRHAKRAEHWVVVAGCARVTRGEETMTLGANQSTFIPVGVKHRLENPGTEPVYLIEVQSGSYLGEDDIERFEDRYGRR
ncbi:MAG: mannose-1-phosphate guanylyltransferase/mannose-6-phosphate isomerase [Burkholderiales bacterium]|nr:mannose-1-phosphate guanylyltransferase/mannose-6-phosphate isomerase [Burkholderiales bacterium]